jgi:hypothetical protein
MFEYLVKISGIINRESVKSNQNARIILDTEFPGINPTFLASLFPILLLLTNVFIGIV